MRSHVSSRENQSGQYLLAVGLNCYKWYQSQSLDGVLARTLGPQGVDCEIPHLLEKHFLLWRGNLSLADMF